MEGFGLLFWQLWEVSYVNGHNLNLNKFLEKSIHFYNECFFVLQYGVVIIIERIEILFFRHHLSKRNLNNEIELF